ncbi:MAG: NTP transferase domain-containing protein [Syntrophobacteraceae bacterium]|nr:NTP transferase domain-containing protein [Desulfobacteraceae bacterium]
MKMGIIAAGTGERLARGGVSIPKPLLPVRGEPLISRIIHAAAKVRADSVACIVNDLNPDIAAYLRGTSWPIPVDVVVKTTPSSMESLFTLAPLLCDGPFLLSTVDTIFGPDTLESFCGEVLRLADAGGALALTRYIDDEKPLYAVIDENRKITAMGADAAGSEYITAGFYFFHPGIFSLVDEARRRKLTALRQFLGLMIESGYPLYGIPVSKTIDVDHPEDIEKAEAFLKEFDEP